MNSSDRNFDSQNSRKKPKYSRLTAQFIRNGVKKQIFDIRKRRDHAANELLDQLESKLINSTQKSAARKKSSAKPSFSNDFQARSAQTQKSHQDPIEEIAATVAEGIALADRLMGRENRNDIDINDLMLRLLASNRRNLLSLLVNLADNFDAESLSCFGTNLIYGGFITETANGSPICRFVDMTKQKSSAPSNELRGMIQTDINSGRRVCIIRGNGLLSEEMCKFYRYFSETAFILIDSAPIQGAGLGIYNILLIPECTGNSLSLPRKGTALRGFAEFSPSVSPPKVAQQSLGSAYSADLRLNTASIEKGIGVNNTSENRDISKISAGKGAFDELTASFSPQNSISALFKFLSAPSLPIKSSTDEFLSALCYLEKLISNGKNCAPIYCEIE